MPMNFNSIDYIDKFVYERIDKIPNTSFSATFRTMKRKVPLIGDYPIFAHIAGLMGDKGIKIPRSQALTALKYSGEYRNNRKRDKTYWVRDMLKVNEDHLKFINKDRRVKEGRTLNYRLKNRAV